MFYVAIGLWPGGGDTGRPFAKAQVTVMFKRLTVVLLAALALTACDRVDPNSPLGKRKAIFKDMLKTMACCAGACRSTA
ncbi:hypothetical protein GCM10011247_16860 [Pseudomonas plecoglossicida]|nr:hypothetical protein GCM10011247_16860 [Pseudomonas plecoglossicida]